MDEKSFSDIQTKTWFDRLLPAWVYPYARLARWDRPVGVWLLFLPCLWGLFFALYLDVASIPQIIKYIMLFFIGSATMRGAGCTINDLWDQKMDGQVERTQNRPLPSGQLSRKQAVGFLILQLIIGALVLFQFNGTTIFIGLLSLPLIVLYPLMKRWTWWPQAFLGITFNWGILMGSAAVMGGISAGILWLYLGAVMWTIAYDTIYAFQDIDDDAMIGIKSTARLFGDQAPKVITFFYVMMGACFTIAGIVTFAHPYYYPIILAIIVLHIVYGRFLWKPHDQNSSLKAFKRHVSLGWCIAVAIIIKFLLTV